MENKVSSPLILSSSPHFHGDYLMERAMREVAVAILPAAAAGIWFFGLHAFLVILLSVAGAILAETLCLRVMGRPLAKDGSVVITGLLLALCLPPTIPLWIAFLGGVFAIVIGKQVFGGLGQNVFNPALIGRALLLASFPVYMTAWTPARGAVDAISSATPLALMKSGAFTQLPPLLHLVTGQIGGCLGETSVIAILIGALVLLIRRHIDWRIPGVYLGTVLVLTTANALVRGYGLTYPLYQLCSGGLLLGAFFMATDWVTSPITKRGRLIYGLGLGLLTCLIRFFGGLSEGVCYSILIMNILTPLIDRYSRGKIYGSKPKEGTAS